MWCIYLLSKLMQHRTKLRELEIELSPCLKVIIFSYQLFSICLFRCYLSFLQFWTKISVDQDYFKSYLLQGAPLRTAIICSWSKLCSVSPNYISKWFVIVRLKERWANWPTTAQDFSNPNYWRQLFSQIKLFMFVQFPSLKFIFSSYCWPNVVFLSSVGIICWLSEGSQSIGTSSDVQ